MLVMGQKYWELDHFTPEVIASVWFGPDRSLPGCRRCPMCGDPSAAACYPESCAPGPAGCIRMHALASGAPRLFSGEAPRLHSDGSECGELVAGSCA